MTAAAPVRDSALDALGYAVGVLRTPRFWWPLIVLSPIIALPLLLVPGTPGTPGAMPATMTQAELDAYTQALFRSIGLTYLVSVLLGPMVTAVAYRLGLQYVDGESPQPLGPGFVSLAWRFFLLTLLYGLVVVLLLMACVALVAVTQLVVGLGLAVLISGIALIIGCVIVIIRLAIATALVASGAGPIEALYRSWQMTRGRVGIAFRWMFVTGLLIAVASGITVVAIGEVFGALGQPDLGQLVGAAVTGPIAVISAIVVILLARLLSGPIEPPLPPAVPTWMSAPGASEPPATPPTTGGG